MADHGPRIVMGLDHNSEYTGKPVLQAKMGFAHLAPQPALAWMWTAGQGSPSLGDIAVFTNWPGRSAPRAPSAISYSKTSGARQWGYSISKDSQVMRWTELELEPRTTVRELEALRRLVEGLDLINELRANEDAAITNDIPRHIARDAGDMVREYLGQVAREWRGCMGQYILDYVPLDIVITHPAVRFPFYRVLKNAGPHP